MSTGIPRTVSGRSKGHDLIVSTQAHAAQMCFPSPTDKMLSPVTKMLGGPRKFLLGGQSNGGSRPGAPSAGGSASLARRAIKQSYMSASKTKPTESRIGDEVAKSTVVEAIDESSKASTPAGIAVDTAAPSTSSCGVTRELSSTPTENEQPMITTPVKTLTFAASPSPRARAILSPTNRRV